MDKSDTRMIADQIYDTVNEWYSWREAAAEGKSVTADEVRQLFSQLDVSRLPPRPRRAP